MLAARAHLVALRQRHPVVATIWVMEVIVVAIHVRQLVHAVLEPAVPSSRNLNVVEPGRVQTQTVQVTLAPRRQSQHC